MAWQASDENAGDTPVRFRSGQALRLQGMATPNVEVSMLHERIVMPESGASDPNIPHLRCRRRDP